MFLFQCQLFFCISLFYFPLENVFPHLHLFSPRTHRHVMRTRRKHTLCNLHTGENLHLFSGLSPHSRMYFYLHLFSPHTHCAICTVEKTCICFLHCRSSQEFPLIQECTLTCTCFPLVHPYIVRTRRKHTVEKEKKNCIVFPLQVCLPLSQMYSYLHLFSPGKHSQI